MITTAIKEYFNCKTSLLTERYELKIKTVIESKKLFGLASFCEINVLVILHTNEIPFREIADAVVKQINGSDTLEIARKARKPLKTVTSLNWFVCSDKGGIYLYEALATKENIHYAKMKNRFIVINTENGTISLGPGHPKNAILSDTMRSLIERFRIMQRDVWLNDVFLVFDACLLYSGATIR